MSKTALLIDLQGMRDGITLSTGYGKTKRSAIGKLPTGQYLKSAGRRKI